MKPIIPSPDDPHSNSKSEVNGLRNAASAIQFALVKIRDLEAENALLRKQILDLRAP